MELVLLESRGEIAALSFPAAALVDEFVSLPDATYTPEYFLPRLYSGAAPRVVACYEDQRLVGIVYTYELLLHGMPTGYAFGGDGMGRGLLVCALEREMEILSACCTFLLTNGIHAIRLDWTPRDSAADHTLRLHRPYTRVKILADPRTDGDWLALQPDYDSFLAQLGSHTRRNMRAYRRKTEASAMTYDGNLSKAELEEAIAFLNAQTDYPVDADRLRRDALYMETFGSAVRACLRNAKGEFVSLLTGFISGRHLHVLTQLNADNEELRKMSISLVLRGYVIEDFIQRGFTAVHFLEGSSSMLGRFCTDVDLHHYSVDDHHALMTPFKHVCATIAEELHRRNKRVPFRLQWAAGSYWTSTPAAWW